MGTTGDAGQDRPDSESTRWLEVPRDTEASFHRAPGRTPEATYAEITARLAGLLEEIHGGRPEDSTPTVERLQRWHRRIFDTTFPRDAGRFRGAHEDQTSYGVWLPDDPDPGNWRMAYVRATSHEQIRPQLERGFGGFADAIPPHWLRPPPHDIARAAAELFVETLRIHPFVDGNMRVSVAMLRAAIHRFGRPTAGLLRSDDWEFAAAFSTALRPDGQARMDRLIDLLAERIGPRGQGSGEAT